MKTNIQIVLVMLLLVSACSPTSRLERLLLNHPELAFKDTLEVNDTVAIPLAQAETAVPLYLLHQPLCLSSGRLEMEIKRVHDTIRIKGKCKPDTIIHRQIIPFERIKWIKPNRTDAIIARIPWLVVGLLALLGIGIFVSVRKRLL